MQQPSRKLPLIPLIIALIVAFVVTATATYLNTRRENKQRASVDLEL